MHQAVDVMFKQQVHGAVYGAQQGKQRATALCQNQTVIVGTAQRTLHMCKRTSAAGWCVVWQPAGSAAGQHPGQVQPGPAACAAHLRCFWAGPRLPGG
jgi:hypothetical protein